MFVRTASKYIKGKTYSPIHTSHRSPSARAIATVPTSNTLVSTSPNQHSRVINESPLGTIRQYSSISSIDISPNNHIENSSDHEHVTSSTVSSFESSTTYFQGDSCEQVVRMALANLDTTSQQSATELRFVFVSPTNVTASIPMGCPTPANLNWLNSTMDNPQAILCQTKLLSGDESATGHQFPITAKLHRIQLTDKHTAEHFSGSLHSIPCNISYSHYIKHPQESCEVNMWITATPGTSDTKIKEYVGRLERLLPYAQISAFIPKQQLLRSAEPSNNVSDTSNIYGAIVRGEMPSSQYDAITRSVFGNIDGVVVLNKAARHQTASEIRHLSKSSQHAIAPSISKHWPTESAAYYSEHRPNIDFEHLSPFVSAELAELYQRFGIVPSTTKPHDPSVLNHSLENVNIFELPVTAPQAVPHLVPGERKVFRFSHPASIEILRRHMTFNEPIALSLMPAITHQLAYDSEGKSFVTADPYAQQEHANQYASREMDQLSLTMAKNAFDSPSAKPWTDHNKELKAFYTEACKISEYSLRSTKFNAYDSSRSPVGCAVGSLAYVTAIFDVAEDGSALVEIEGLQRVKFDKVWRMPDSFGLVQASAVPFDDIDKNSASNDTKTSESVWTAEYIANLIQAIHIYGDPRQQEFNTKNDTLVEDMIPLHVAYNVRKCLRKWALHSDRLIQRQLPADKTIPPSSLSWWLAEILPVSPARKLQYIRQESTIDRLILQLNDLLDRAWISQPTTPTSSSNQAMFVTEQSIVESMHPSRSSCDGESEEDNTDM